MAAAGALTLTDWEHQGGAEEEEGGGQDEEGGGGDPRSKYCSSPQARRLAIFLQGTLVVHSQPRCEHHVFERLDFARLEVSSLLQSALKSLKAWGIATLCAATPSPLGNWALNIALAKNQILYGRCTLMATTLQTLQCKAVSSSQSFFPTFYWIATSLPFFPLLECAFVVGAK